MAMRPLSTKADTAPAATSRAPASSVQIILCPSASPFLAPAQFKDCCPKRPGDTCHGAHMVHEVTPKNERKKEQRIAAAQTHQPPPKRGPSSAARTPPSKGQQPAPSSRGPHGMPSGGAAAAGGGGGGSGSRRSSCSDGGCSCCTGGSDVHSRSSGCSYDTGCDTGGSIDGGGTFLQDYFPPAPTKPGQVWESGGWAWSRTVQIRCFHVHVPTAVACVESYTHEQIWSDK